MPTSAPPLAGKEKGGEKREGREMGGYGESRESAGEGKGWMGREGGKMRREGEGEGKIVKFV